MRSALAWMMAVNVGVFLLWHLLPPEWLPVVASHLVVSPTEVLWRPWTLVTSAFSHHDLNHLLFNMLGMWVFGRDTERAIGRFNTVLLVVAGGVAASLAHVGLGLMFEDPVPALGASGAVMALGAVYARLFPTRVILVNFILPLRARWAFLLYVGIDLLGVVGPGDGVAHGAHLGGAAFGLVFGWLLRTGRPRPSP